MLRDVFHPATEQISLSAVYDALSDPVRRLIVAKLAEHGELSCARFLDYGSKTGISYHLARLREAGVTATRIDGKQRHMKLRLADLEQRFPGLLPAVIASALQEARVADGKKPFCISPEEAAQSPAAAGPALKSVAAQAAPSKTAKAAAKTRSVVKKAAKGKRKAA